MQTPTAEQVNEAMLGFDRLYGLRLDSFDEECASAHVLVRDELRQPAGLVHGGVLASIAESLASLVTAMAVFPDSLAVGQSNHTSFMRPITAGTIHAHAQRLHRGRTTWVWDVRFEDDENRLCAVTRMTIAVRPRPAV